MEKFKNLPVGTLIRHPNFGVGIIIGSYGVNYRVSFKSYYDQKNLLGSFVDNNCDIDSLSKYSFEEILKRGAYVGLFKNEFFEPAITLAKSDHILEIKNPIKGIYEGTIRAESIYHPQIEYINGCLNTTCDCKEKKNCKHALALLLYLNKNKVEFKSYTPSKYYEELLDQKETLLALFYTKNEFIDDTLKAADDLIQILNQLSLRDFGELINNIKIDASKAKFMARVFAYYPRFSDHAKKIALYEPSLNNPFIKLVNDTANNSQNASIAKFFESYFEHEYKFINMEAINSKECLACISYKFDKYYPLLGYAKEELFNALADRNLFKKSIDKLDEKSQNLIYVDYYPLFVKEGTSDRVITTKDVLLALQQSDSKASDKIVRITFIVKKCVKENNESLLVETLFKIIKSSRLSRSDNENIISIIDKLPNNDLLKPTFMELINDKPRFSY